MSDDAEIPVDPGTSEEQIRGAVLSDQLAPVLGAVNLAANPLAGFPMLMLSGNQIRVARVADGGGGGYEFSPAQIDAAIKKFEDVLDKAKKAGARLREAAATISPPASDGPSTRQADGARNSLQRAQQHNRTLQDYAESFLNKLDTAKRDYQDAEDHNTGNANRQM